MTGTELTHQTTGSAIAALSQCSTTTRALASASLSPATIRAYKSTLATLDTWMDGRPLTDALLADYLAHRHDTGASASTLAMVVAAVRFAANAAGITNPVGKASAMVLQGARRSQSGRGRGQVAGINWHAADAMTAIAGANGVYSVTGLRDAAMIAIASDAMLRASELAALRIDDIACCDDGSGTVTIRRSKTDQEGKGQVLYLRQSTMERIHAYTGAVGIAGASDTPLLRRIAKGGSVQSAGLTTYSIRRILQTRAKAAGITGRISGHSLRVGAAQSLVQAGASLVECQIAGRWKSPAMPAHYARAQQAAQGAVARLRTG